MTETPDLGKLTKVLRGALLVLAVLFVAPIVGQLIGSDALAVTGSVLVLAGVAVLVSPALVLAAYAFQSAELPASLRRPATVTAVILLAIGAVMLAYPAQANPTTDRVIGSIFVAIGVLAGIGRIRRSQWTDAPAPAFKSVSLAGLLALGFTIAAASVGKFRGTGNATSMELMITSAVLLAGAVAMLVAWRRLA